MPLEPHDLSVAILAGGKSTRMGHDKALLKIGDRPMLQRVLESIPHWIEDRILIANHNDYNFWELPTYPDLIPNCGPLSGIHSALTHIRHSNCLILACDLPFITSELLEQLTSHHTSRATVLESANGPEPLCAVYSQTCLPVIKAQLQSGNYTARALLEQLGAVVMRPNIRSGDDGHDVLLNVNTPAQLQHARDKWHKMERAKKAFQNDKKM